MTKVLDGQLSALDLLEPEAPAAPEYEDTDLFLAKTDVGFAVMQIRLTTEGATLRASCCNDEADLHGEWIFKPTVQQWADHLRQSIDKADKNQRIRDEFNAWLGPYLVKHGALRYALDPQEYPHEVAEFAVHLTRPEFPSQPCGYCGRELTMTEGNGGGVQNLPDGRRVHWMICNKCNDKHGHPDLDTHPNLKVKS